MYSTLKWHSIWSFCFPGGRPKLSPSQDGPDKQPVRRDHSRARVQAAAAGWERTAVPAAQRVVKQAAAARRLCPSQPRPRPPRVGVGSDDQRCRRPARARAKASHSRSGSGRFKAGQAGQSVTRVITQPFKTHKASRNHYLYSEKIFIHTITHSEKPQSTVHCLSLF